MSEQAIEELVRATLNHHWDDGAYWEGIESLWALPAGTTFGAARSLCDSADWNERRLGATILGGPKGPDRVAPDARQELLLDLLARERHPRVVEAIVSAVGRFSGRTVAEALWAFREHPDETVRWTLTFAAGDRPDAEAFDLLSALSCDQSAWVRDWATHHLALSKRDSPELRDVLVARIADDDRETREEALRGLARRGDTRALEPVLLSVADIDNAKEPSYVAEAAVYMAAATGDRRFRPFLIDEHHAQASDDGYPGGLQDAMRACFGSQRPPLRG